VGRKPCAGRAATAPRALWRGNLQAALAMHSIYRAFSRLQKLRRCPYKAYSEPYSDCTLAATAFLPETPYYGLESRISKHSCILLNKAHFQQLKTAILSLNTKGCWAENDSTLGKECHYLNTVSQHHNKRHENNLEEPKFPLAPLGTKPSENTA